MLKGTQEATQIISLLTNSISCMGEPVFVVKRVLVLPFVLGLSKHTSDTSKRPSGKQILGGVIFSSL